jgi:hypothetical protein
MEERYKILLSGCFSNDYAKICVGLKIYILRYTALNLSPNGKLIPFPVRFDKNLR